MGRVRREPLGIAGAIILLVKVALTWLTVMGIVEISEQQQQITVALAVAIVDLVVAITALFFARRKTTPLTDARDSTGDSLVRTSDGRRPIQHHEMGQSK